MSTLLTDRPVKALKLDIGENATMLSAYEDDLPFGGSARAGIFAAQRTEPLPFTIRLARSPLDIERATALRAEAYARHNAPAADMLREPELADFAGDAVLLIAESKLTGAAVGSIRLQSNHLQPLMFERSAIDVPPQYRGAHSVELMRLGVARGGDGLRATAALAKSSYLISLAVGAHFAFVTGRKPVTQIYAAYHFDDVLDGRKIRLDYAPGADLSLLVLPLAEAASRWRSRNPAVSRFMLDTHHPDLQIDMDEVRLRMKRPAACPSDTSLRDRPGSAHCSPVRPTPPTAAMS